MEQSTVLFPGIRLGRSVCVLAHARARGGGEQVVRWTKIEQHCHLVAMVSVAFLKILQCTSWVDETKCHVWDNL